MESLNRPLPHRIRALAEPVAERLGLDLVAVEVFGGRGVLMVRLSIDKVGGVGIDECTHFSRALSPVLDVEDPIIVAYTLEVSSPGMERPLQRASDFRRFQGCQIRVRLAGMDGRRWLKGKIQSVTDQSASAGEEVILQSTEGPRVFSVEEVERAYLELTMEQFTRMGQGLPPVPEEESS